MWKCSKYVALFSLTLLLTVFTYGQDCNITLSGSVEDLSTDNPISFANIFVKEIQTGDVTDSLGVFSIEALCPGKYHLSISHIGCETQEVFITVSRDTALTILLDHHSHLLHEVAITGQGDKVTTQETQSLNTEHISQNSDKNLARMLSNISGVSTIRNGNGIAKPLVHGLYGNRLSILNNGIAQSGQQWGIDHSPEIDPLVANRITVIKGVGALEYQGSSLGSVVLVEPQRIAKEPHLHGEARYFFESNGLGNGLNLELQQNTDKLGWRAVGTLKKAGDRRSSKYFLRNTGSQEANIALQLEKSWKSRLFTDLYFSSFNAEFGVLRGSQIGSTNDLAVALERDVPFYTEDHFSYAIDPPFQRVNHQLLKFHAKYSISEAQWFDFTYAVQHNLRKEFDVRRGGRSGTPALSLEQVSKFTELKYQNFFDRNWGLKAGVQSNAVDNVNLDTGILPLIPDYISTEFGVFALVTKSYEHAVFELGGRYDLEQRNVADITNTDPREVIRYSEDYTNISIMGGFTQELSENWKASCNLGFSARNPEVNELYSMGLHQGVSGIEEGDTNLGEEVSLKSTLSIKGNVNSRWSVEGLFYHQKIEDYIFLKPQEEIRLTIRGAFPVFKYEQTDARLFGFDLATIYSVSDRVNVSGKYSFLDGFDSTNEVPLVFMAPNNLSASLNYEIPKLGDFHNVGFEIGGRYVFEQKNLLASQDFARAPEAYYLIDLKVSAERQLRNLRLNTFVRAENLLNETYRDYLNRQRYFADDLGINVLVGLNVSF